MVLSIKSRYEKTVQKPHPQGYPEEPETIGEHIRKRQMDLKLYQTDVERRLGGSEDCLCYWENWRNQPRLYQYPAIFVFLGFYPFDHETATYGGKIRRYKYEQGLNNEKLAKLFGLWMKGRVAEWERNKRAPLARSMEKLLSIINKTAAY